MIFIYRTLTKKNGSVKSIIDRKVHEEKIKVAKFYVQIINTLCALR
ncbi:MAG TPA: hypothetical protein PK252_03910 [Bacteroidales bacterium]|nr:hypothetical protein [Bacteroidales bacterium]